VKGSFEITGKTAEPRAEKFSWYETFRQRGIE
jgi:hypothetical protein